MADKIFLADKKTLDEVKQGVIDLGLNLENTGNNVEATKTAIESVGSKVETIGIKIDTLGANKNLSSPIPVSRKSKYNFLYKDISSGTNYNNITTITGPGTLYIAVISNNKDTTNNANNTTSVQLIADGETIYKGAHTVSGGESGLTYTGFITGPSVVGINTGSNYNNAIMVTSVGIHIPASSITPFTGSTGNSNQNTVYSMSPIKFNTSLVVQGYSTNAATSSIRIYYELD